MIFQHTIDDVLSGRKTGTTRIWKDYYRAGYKNGVFVDVLQPIEQNSLIKAIWSVNNDKKRKLYYIGQKLSVQPGRGKKGIATIEITRLTKIQIHHVIEDKSFIAREGFSNKAEFLKVWRDMHGMKQTGLHIQFKLI